MSEGQTSADPNVEQMPAPAKSAIVSDELNRIAGAVRAIAPRDAAISFEFSRKLEINIDVRTLEDVARLETLLPTLCGGIFSRVERGPVDNHPFLHRLTALVDR